MILSNQTIDYKPITDYVLINRNSWTNESEVRVGWIGAINQNSTLDLETERKWNDASYNQIIIEFKGPGLFNGKDDSTAFLNAKNDRLKKYINKKSVEENIDRHDYIGIAIDGFHTSFCTFSENTFVHSPLIPINEFSVIKILDAIANNGQRALTSYNLIDDFGLKSECGSEFLGVLYSGLKQYVSSTNNNKILMLYEEWKTLFGQVSGLTNEQTLSISGNLPFSIEDDNSNENISIALFAIHSYNSILIKLLGAELVSKFNLTQYANFIDNLIARNDHDLIDSLDRDIEQGKLYDTLGVKSFVSEAIFSWYLELFEVVNLRKSLLESVRRTAALLSVYRFDRINTGVAKDLLKDFYHGLVPETLRKSLGEFYTPDWLIEYTYSTLQLHNIEEIRILDPTCGSGSFLISAIDKIKLRCTDLKLSDSETLEKILGNVWGFDLNPIAVQSARVNYLLAISDLIPRNEPINIEIPILLADSVYSPARDPQSNEDVVVYKIGSSVANLTVKIPSDLAYDRPKLDAVFVEMENGVLENFEFRQVYERLVRKNLVILGQYTRWYFDSLKETYDNVLALHHRNWNGIWFRIVRNFFWSAVAGKFDLVVGNPPWVRWSNLPTEYRDKIKPTCLQYDIFSSSPYHGGNELDISGMITYSVVDKWMKAGSKLAFVITQSHFQSPSSEGFRSWIIDEEHYMHPTRIDDLSNLKPFSDATNKTAILNLTKVKGELEYSNIYPVPYYVWSANPGIKRTIPTSVNLDYIIRGFSIIEKDANPVDTDRTPWAIMNKGVFETIEHIRGESTWVQGRKGVTADLNAIYMVDLVSTSSDGKLSKIITRPNAGRKNVGPAKEFWVESKFLYPLIKGASDLSANYFKPKQQNYFIIPNKGITQSYLDIMVQEVEFDSEKILLYFQSYEKLLSNRSTYKIRMSKWPYYAVYNVGKYTFAPFKVVWAEMSGKFEAAVATSKPVNGQLKPYIPDHKIYFADFNEKEIAYYLCGILNYSKVAGYIESHTISIQVSNIFKHLNIPEYDANSNIHRSISQLSEDCHNEDDILNRQRIMETIEELCSQII